MAKQVFEFQRDGDDEATAVIIRPIHHVRFEEEYGDLTDDESGERTTKRMYRLVYVAAGQPGGDFDAWLESLLFCEPQEKIEDGGDGGPAEKPKRPTKRQ